MRGIPLTLSLVLLLAVLSPAQVPSRREYRELNVPGKLEKALLSNPLPILRQELGSLTPPGTVRFFAVIASDAVTKNEVKGLEVQLEGDDPWNGNHHGRDTVYIDEESLDELQHGLRELMEGQRSRASHLADYDEEQLRTPSITLAGNHASLDVYYVPVEFGSYWENGRFGVYVLAPRSGPTSGPHPTTQFRLPNADISEVWKLVNAGRELLRQQRTEQLGAPSGAE